MYILLEGQFTQYETLESRKLHNMAGANLQANNISLRPNSRKLETTCWIS